MALILSRYKNFEEGNNDKLIFISQKGDLFFHKTKKLYFLNLNLEIS